MQNIDEKARLEALKNPRAKGATDMVRAINRAQSTRATPPTAPPENEVVELKPELTAQDVTPWATQTSSTEIPEAEAVAVQDLSSEAAVIQDAADRERTRQSAPLARAIDDKKRKPKRKGQSKNMRVAADALMFTQQASRSSSTAAKGGARVSKTRASFSSSAASNAVTPAASANEPLIGDDQPREADSSGEGRESEDEDWGDVLTRVMGSEQGHGPSSTRRAEAPLSPASLPGMVEDDQTGDTDGGKSAGVSALNKKPLDCPALNPNPPESCQRADGDNHQNESAVDILSQDYENSNNLKLGKEKGILKDQQNGEGQQHGDSNGPTRLNGYGENQQRKKPKGPGHQNGRFSLMRTFSKYADATGNGELEDMSYLQRWFLYFKWLWFGLMRKLSSRKVASVSQRHVAPILITPVKRLEREAHKSSKRVHFKLRRKTEAVMFKPLHRTSYLIQAWLMGMVVPLIFDIFAFGIRVAFCDMYLRQNLFIWHIDLFCDVWKLADMAVSLVTVVPKHTYPRQTQTASTLRAIASLYFKHEFLWHMGPMFIYQITSIVFLSLPQNEYHRKRSNIYMWIWFVSMMPRFASDVRRVHKYAGESIVDPKVTSNVKQFQFVKIIMYILIFAHLIGCTYYFLARINGFDETTWINAFEGALPFYKKSESNVGGDYLLIIFKGFCRVASLGYDPGLPANMGELLLAMLVMALSIYVSSLILGTLLTYLVRRDPFEVAYTERLEGLRLYMERKHLPEDMHESVVRYCKFQYIKGKKGSAGGNDLFLALSESLRIEVANAYHRDLINRCSKIGRPFHRCSEAFFNALVVKLYTVHVMPGDHVVHKDEIPRELYFVSSGAVQVVDEHDQVVSVIRSDVPDTAPIVGEVPFFLGINYLKAMKASLDGDVQLEVLSKDSLTALKRDYPADCTLVGQNLWSQYDSGRGGKGEDDDDDVDELNLDSEKLLTKKRILETTNFRKEQQFLELCKAARSGDVESVVMLARQGANLNQTDYDGRTAMHMACSSGRYKVVESLLKIGAAVDMKDRWGQTPMGIAISAKQQMIITVLAASGKAKLDMASPELALCSAAGSGDLQQVKRLVDFGVRPDLGDYDLRTALHVSSAEGHEKIVEYLLLSQADPNCKDRWGGTPLQDALTGGHIGTAHILKAKGAAVPDSFGAEAVCTAAGKGDVPKLRMLHSFGQSLDVGDYDDRNALHLASAEGRVLAVSFLLGISSDPNRPDRWSGTPMDDCVRGGTLYHKYCAKLLQGWGGELGTFKDTTEGDDFLTSLEVISIKSIREVIRRLIDQGLDKECPERMDDQQLIVCMTATVRHMPLVTQLHRNTSIITKEMRHFRHIVHTFVNQVHSNVASVLEILLQGTRRVPELDTNITDDLKPQPNRPRTAKEKGAKTRKELNRELDLFNGIEQLDNSRVLDSLSLESPFVSHQIIAPPIRITRQLLQSGRRGSTGQASRSQSRESRRLRGAIGRILRSSSAEIDLESFRANADENEIQQLHAQLTRDATMKRFAPSDTQSRGVVEKKQVGWAARELQSRSMANLSKRNNQRAEALLKTLFDSTIPPMKIRECSRMLRKSDKIRFKRMTEMTEGMIDSDTEEALHTEIDSITHAVDKIEGRGEDWFQKTGARMFNQLALHIVNVEHAFKILHQVLCTFLPKGIRHEANPMISMDNLARALVVLQANTRQIDLDKIVEHVHEQMKPFRLLVTPKERRADKDKPSGSPRFSKMIAASSVFRDAILTMDVDQILCKLMKSKMCGYINEELGRLLLTHARSETKKANDVLHNDGNVADHRYLTLVLAGEVLVVRTLDDVEIGRGKCSVGCYFGAFKALQVLDGVVIPEEQQEVPFKEGGSGVNSCIISAAGQCEIIRMHMNDVHEVLHLLNDHQRDSFYDNLIERLTADLGNLESLNALVLASTFDDSSSMDKALHEAPDWTKAPKSRKYYSQVPELDRKEIQDSFQNIQNLWKHLARGANTVPKGSVDMIKEHLGEGGLECYTNVFLPMEEPTAPTFFNEECFWFCWVHFLAKTIAHSIENEEQEMLKANVLNSSEAGALVRNDSDGEDNENEGGAAEGEDVKSENRKSHSGKGVVTVTVKHGSRLSPMDTFSGKADPYLVLTVEGVTQKTQVKSGTLDPAWDETMQFNAVASKSVIKAEVFDSEAMGQDRTMGSFSIIVPPNPVLQPSSHKLTGRLADGRMAQGSISLSICFVRGAQTSKTSEQKTEFQLFYETENIKDWILFWLMPSRRIEKAFFAAPLPVHEREFIKAVGTLAMPLTGLAIKQYLTYLLVEHSHQVDVYTCREFVGFFKRKLDDETSIAYRDIVKVVKERNSGLNNTDLFIGSTYVLNPEYWMLRAWKLLVRLVALYHIFMVPLRIGFNFSPSLTSRLVLSTDLPADLILFIHVLLSFNIGYKNSKSQWITSRFRVFKNTDWILVLAVLPIEWIVYLSGMDAEDAVWFRVNKTLVYFSRMSPAAIIYSQHGGSILDLVVVFLIICHFCACIFYYLGTNVPKWNLGRMHQISWLHADASLGVDTYDRNWHFAMRPEASGIDRYVLSLYWVLSTITCQGVIGEVSPQNFMEVAYAVALLVFNLTIYRWIAGEIANMVMNADEKVIRTREEQDRILKFISVNVFSRELCERIRSHLQLVWHGNVSEEQDRLLASLSHGLRVEIARYIWREFLAKVHIFRGCSGQFLDAVCVLVYEKHYGPEESIGKAGEVMDHLVVLVHGGFETFSDESSRVKRVHRKGQAVGMLSVFFGVKQYFHSRAGRAGAVCVSLEKTGLGEVLQIYPKDEERVRKNVLNFYSKDKTTEGSVAFSTFSDDDSQDSDESHHSASSRGTSNSRNSGRTASSRRSSSSKASASSRGSDGTEGTRSKHSADSHGSDASKKKRGKKGKKGVAGVNDNANLEIACHVSDGGSGLVLDDDEDETPAAVNLDEEETQLLKETDHVPLIRERLLEDKISHILTVSATGDLLAVQASLQSGDITIACKDSLGRTPLHVAASEGHAKLVEYLIEQKADPSAKDKFHNTPFNDAVRSQHDAVATLMRRMDPNIAFKLGGNELGVLMCQAAFDGRLQDMKRLVDNGVDPNEDDYDGRTAMHLAASEGKMDILEYLVGIKANIMCRDRFNGTPLEDAVRHHFDTRNADAVQKLLREHGATLAGEGLNYVVKMCEYSASGSTEHIRLLATNGVDVSMGDYDDRTPLHLAACCGNTAVLEYLLKQDTVLVNAVDRFGGTPYQDAIRHDRKGAAALLEEAGCVRPGDGESHEVIQKMIERANMRKEERLRKEREPKINHVLGNSQESKMVATISDKLSKEIADQSAQIELISQRLIWALRGFGDRLHRNSCNIPFTDATFVKSTEHVLKLVGEMRTRVNLAREKLMSEVQGDAGAADCLIWRNASKEYKREARELDDQMRELILLSIVTKRMLKEVIKVCHRGARQGMYAETSTPMRGVLNAALLHEEQAKAVENRHQGRLADLLSPLGGRSPKSSSTGKKVRWGGLRQVVNLGAKLGLGFGVKRPDMSEHGTDLSQHP